MAAGREMRGVYTQQAVAEPGTSERASRTLAAVTRDPAFGVYLLALAVLPFRWLSPAGSLQQHAEWTDILVAVAAMLWLVQKVRAGALRRSLRTWQLPLGLYVALGAVSYALAVPGRGASATTVLLMAELAVLAAITADFAGEPQRRRAIARVIAASAGATVLLGALALILFYAGAHSGLIGAYGEQFTPSHLYGRVQAGFESPPLLASFCIFASGVIASDAAAIPRRLRIALQITLGLLCAATLSRGLIGFLLALTIRWSAKVRGPRRWLVPTAAAIVCLAAIAALTVGRLHLEPGSPSKSSYVVPDPGNRREAFVSSLQTLEHHPLLGIGPGAIPGVNRGAPFRAHFTPLEVAATVGLPALAALTITVLLVWRGRRRPTDVALWSAAAGIALDGLAQDIDHFRHVWLLLGLLGS